MSDPTPPQQPQPDQIPFAQSIGYATPTTNTRPGLVTAIGVISIVLGCMGTLYHGLSVLQSIAFYTLRNITVNAPAAQATAPAATQPGALAPIDPPTFVAALNQSSGNALTPAAQAALEKMLADPNQSHAPPGTLPGQVVATIDANGGGTFNFPGGAVVTVSGDGTQTSSFNFSGAGANPFGNMSRLTLGVAMASSLLSLATAVLLLVAGIFAIRNSLRALRLHWIYVAVKIPLAALSAVGTYWVYNEMFSSFNAGNTGGPNVTGMGTGVAILSAITFVLAVAYPVGLLFALRARSVREYFHVDGAQVPARVGA